MALPNILIVGLSPLQTSIVVSHEVVRILSREELTAIIAQRLQLMMAGHVTFATMTAALASVIFVTNDALCFACSLGWLRHKKQIRLNPLSMLIQIFFFPLAGIFVWLGWFPHKELEADQTATKLTKTPQALADALWKMDNYARSQPIGGNLATAHLFIVDPFREHPWSRAFSAHPEIKERIRKIIGRYPYN